MAFSTQIEFLKVLACMAWADQELTNAEINVIKRFMREFGLSGNEWMQVAMYLDVKVDAEETKRVIRRFLSRVHNPRERKRLIAAVEELQKSDENRTPSEREWMQELHDAVAETRRGRFLLDGLKSFLRIGASETASASAGREAQFHDFLHNRVLFALRHRVDSKKLESVGSPKKIKELTLYAAFLAQVGYVDDTFVPQEKAFIEKLLRKSWGVPPSVAEAVTDVAIEVVGQGLDVHRMIQEAKSTLSMNKRKTLIEALFSLSQAEGKMSFEEIEAIRKIAYGLDFSHREFINAKLKVLGRD
jgi:uncharacterized tellurite resistance protein B-like protein